MKRTGRSVDDAAREAQVLLDEILAGAGGEDEQLRALRQAFEEGVPLLADAFVIGEPVSVTAIDYDGNTRRGLTATCRRPDGSEHAVAGCDVVFAADADGARHVAAYRRWLGLSPVVTAARHAPHRSRRHKAAEEDLDLGAPLELVALAVMQSAARCRILGTGREVTLRSRDVWRVVPGEILTVRGRKQWRYAGHPYLSGDVDDLSPGRKAGPGSGVRAVLDGAGHGVKWRPRDCRIPLAGRGVRSALTRRRCLS